MDKGYYFICDLVDAYLNQKRRFKDHMVPPTWRSLESDDEDDELENPIVHNL